MPLTAVGVDPLAVDPTGWRWCGTVWRELTSTKWNSSIQGLAFAGSDDAPERTMPPRVEGPRIGRNIASLPKLRLTTAKNLGIRSSSRGRLDYKSDPRRRRGGEGLRYDFQPHSCTKPEISKYATANRHQFLASNSHLINEVVSPVCFYLLPRVDLGSHLVAARKP
jgi:hypothetical protein